MCAGVFNILILVTLLFLGLSIVGPVGWAVEYTDCIPAVSKTPQMSVLDMTLNNLHGLKFLIESY